MCHVHVTILQNACGTHWTKLPDPQIVTYQFVCKVLFWKMCLSFYETQLDKTYLLNVEALVQMYSLFLFSSIVRFTHHSCKYKWQQPCVLYWIQNVTHKGMPGIKLESMKLANKLLQLHQWGPLRLERMLNKETQVPIQRLRSLWHLVTASTKCMPVHAFQWGSPKG